MKKPLQSEITEARAYLRKCKAAEYAAEQAHIAAQRERRVAQFRLARLEQLSALEWTQ